MEPLEQWTGLKSDLTNYRLNSSILIAQSISFWIGKNPFPQASEGVRPRIVSCNFHFQEFKKTCILRVEIIKIHARRSYKIVYKAVSQPDS
jgi:hypothetical protein